MKKIYISPSTQEKNITALGNTEEDLMHVIAAELLPLLKYNGFTVYQGQRSQSLEQMVVESNNLKVDAHVALHSNATGTGQKARGYEIYHYPSSSNGIKLANAIYKQIGLISPAPGRGIKPTNTLYEIVYTHAPAVLLEVDFHDNLDGAIWIRDNTGQIAAAIAKGICDYLGVNYKSNDLGNGKYKNALIKVKSIIDEALQPGE